MGRAALSTVLASRGGRNAKAAYRFFVDAVLLVLAGHRN